MSNPLQPTIFVATHENRGLFSDYFLNHIAKTLPEWKDDNGLFTEAKNLREDLRLLLASIHPESLDEAQLEDQWVKPVLAKLGHQWSVQVKIRYWGTKHRKPDYGFTQTLEDARALTNRIYEPAEIAHLLAVGDAKAWGVPLDRASGSERNPSQQIDEYLRYSELPWGILTDGRWWRLYHRDSSKNNDYYAVDLPALLASEDPDAVHNFYYFYLFFRQAAFFPGGWLEKVLSGSVSYAEGLSDQLEDEVYEALRLIAEGFLRYRRNALTTDPQTLRTIYEQSLVLLYRLLFILYAESRDILPISTNKAYADYSSLRSIAGRAANKMEQPTALRRNVDIGETYNQLNDLFFIIDVGSPEYQVSPYNGRLFSAENHPFLADKRVGDAYLVPAIDRLARVDAVVRGERDRRRVQVDYRDLDVRHLGAIYEKLLDYDLEVAAADLKVKGNRYVPAASGETPDVKKDEVFLRTGNNERKITGSYYTPDYIVRFIVERSLEPLLTQITEKFATLDAEAHWIVPDENAEPLRQAILNINVLDPATGSGHFMVEAVAYIAEWLRKLALKPADLAGDEDELAYWKRQAVTNCIYGVDVNPLTVELAKLSLWLATLGRGKPLSFLDHHVKLGNTLVGARAAEITASLPLAMRERGAGGEGEQNQLPLFNDTAFVETLSAAVGRMAAIEGAVVTSISVVKRQERDYAWMRTVLEPWRALADTWTARHFGLNLAPEQWQALYTAIVNRTPPDALPGSVEPESQPAAPEKNPGRAPSSYPDRRNKNVYGAPPRLHRKKNQAANYILPDAATPVPADSGDSDDDLPDLLPLDQWDWPDAETGDIIQAALAATAQHHFFHWDLEFPEVFFDADGKPLPDGGFDAVIGNPPYVRQQSISPYKPYLAANYEIFHNSADLFLYFYERALKLVKPSRQIGYITSGTYMNSSGAANFRRYLHEQAAFETVVNFGENQPFRGAEMVYPSIAILRNGKAKPTFRSLFIEDVYRRNELGDAIKNLPMVETASDVTGLDEWRFQSSELTEVFRKVTEGFSPLQDVINGQIYYGILTGFNEAFYIDSAKKTELINEHNSSAEIIKPMVRGQDLRPWYQIDTDQFMIVARQGIKIEEYPAIERHLNKYRQQLEVQPRDWDEKKQGAWKGRTWGHYEWCEWHDTVAYFEEFSKPKIFYPDISKLPRYSWDTTGLLIDPTGTIIIPNHASTLALLNSRVLWFVFSQIAIPLRLRAGLWQYRGKLQFVRRLPIPKLSAGQESDLAGLAEEITALARGRYELHEKMRGRISQDLGAGGKLNQALESWWELDALALHEEVKKGFKRPIPLSERDEWEKYLADQKAKHDAATAQIVEREIRLNAIVYAAFKLDREEIGLIETATKYPYGAV